MRLQPVQPSIQARHTVQRVDIHVTRHVCWHGHVSHGQGDTGDMLSQVNWSLGVDVNSSQNYLSL